jgi:hypothetical protein
MDFQPLRHPLILVIIAQAQLMAAPPIEKVILWGHKLHSHTHSYIHERFFRAFEYLDYPTYWFDDNDDVSHFDFTHSLFITEGQVDQNIPLRFDCQYVLHHCDPVKYQPLVDSSLCVFMYKYTDEVKTIPNLMQIEPFIYYDIPGKSVYFPWASDYLPHEIDQLKEQVIKKKEKQSCIYWIGTIGDSNTPFGNSDEIYAFVKASAERNIEFVHFDPWSKGLDRQVCTTLLKSGYFSPAIVGKWQAEHGYIPCRIFISICCGQMGITNSYTTYELFNKKIVYNPDCYQLFYDAIERQKTWTPEDQIELMDFIKEKHTYLNRIHTLLDFMSLTNNPRNMHAFISSSPPLILPEHRSEICPQ